MWKDELVAAGTVKMLTAGDIESRLYPKLILDTQLQERPSSAAQSDVTASGHCRTSRYHWRHKLPHSALAGACYNSGGHWRPGQHGVTVVTSQHEMWRGRVQVFADSVSSGLSIPVALELRPTCSMLSPQMDHADSPKRIWNRLRFRRLDHALLRYFWWYTEVFLHGPSFSSQTMRVRSHPYLILTTTFPGRSVHSLVTSKRRSYWPTTFGRSSAKRSARVRWACPNLRLRPNVIIWHSVHLYSTRERYTHASWALRWSSLVHQQGVMLLQRAFITTLCRCTPTVDLCSRILLI